MHATIVGKAEVARGTLLVQFDVSPNVVSFKAGQFFNIGLIDPPYSDEKGNRRHFSIVNSPNEKSILTMATRLSDSAFKRSLKELPVGAEVEIGSIGGRFVLPADSSRLLVFVSGGIGITPFISMLRYIEEETLPYKVTLLYANRDRASTAFLEELTGMASQNPKFTLVLTMTQDPDWEGENRRIDSDFIRDHNINSNSCTYYVAGPSSMVKATCQVLWDVGVDPSNIVLESFSGY